MKLHPIYQQLQNAYSRVANSGAQYNSAPEYSFYPAGYRLDDYDAHPKDFLVSAQVKVLQNLNRVNEESNRRLIQDVETQINACQMQLEHASEQETRLKNEYITLQQELQRAMQHHGEAEKTSLEQDIYMCSKSLDTCVDQAKLSLGKKLAHLREYIRQREHEMKEQIKNREIRYAQQDVETLTRQLNDQRREVSLLCEYYAMWGVKSANGIHDYQQRQPPSLGSVNECISALQKPDYRYFLDEITAALKNNNCYLEITGTTARVLSEYAEIYLVLGREK